ncbi:uncharacterized protein LOC134773596 [Penaeus indicus]|uniref:uncharacterized protein LOC134773596 n=1 Tax=Penaeus indicus TaxID=29960 RepID=UPI00300D6569
MLMGSNKQTITYIYNTQRQKVDTVEEMEPLHREFWQQNFQISPTENARFDHATETEVTNYIQQHRNLFLPENTIRLNTLTEDSPLSTPITPEEITNTIKPLATGYFPDKFKHATLTLIPKPGKSTHQVGNYRPISLLEVPGKLLERVITQRLIPHLENNQIHNTRQYGFRPHRGTESAIALACEEIALGLANKHQTNAILRDVSKAFDKAPPSTSEVEYHREEFYRQPSNILHTASLPEPTPYSNYISYADDITQIITHPSKSQHFMKQKELYRTSTSLSTTGKYRQTNKFKLIPIARKKSQPITINNTNIPYPNTGNILGLQFTTAGFLTHVKHRITQAQITLTKLKRFSCCTPQTKLILYKTTVLEYTAIPLVAISYIQKLKMQSVKNKALLWFYCEVLAEL